MKITFISDTHNRHDLVKIEPTDVLIHCGDMTSHGSFIEVSRVLEWFSRQPAKTKIMIAGNHDWLFYKRQDEARMLLGQHKDIWYLQDSMMVVGGLRIYGSPWQPRFYNWAFNADDDQLKEYWEQIPNNIDLLITHGPPSMIRDVTYENINAGCPILLNEIVHRIKPKYHAFGHIHEGYGIETIGDTCYINASTCDRKYKPTNAPLIIEI